MGLKLYFQTVLFQKKIKKKKTAIYQFNAIHIYYFKRKLKNNKNNKKRYIYINSKEKRQLKIYTNNNKVQSITGISNK